MHSSALLSDGRVLILTSETDDSDKYCVLVLSSSDIKKIEICNCSEDRRNYPVLFRFEEGFGIIKKGQQCEYYTVDFSSPERLSIKNGDSVLQNIVPKKAQQRYF